MLVRIAGIGAWGPGFEDWESLRQRFDDTDQKSPEPCTIPAPGCIPPRERRRAPLSVKLAVEVAGQACGMSGIEPGNAACVFASGMGDMQITDYMCRTLVSEDPRVSPTRFHNSVHNAPVGYWSISQGCKQASNAISAFTHSIPASLLEAAIQCEVEAVPVLFATQDIAAPRPFQDIAHIESACAFALMLLPAHNPGMALQLELGSGSGRWPPVRSAQLSELYEHNPSARLLALLELLAAGGEQRLTMPLNDSLDLVLSPAAA